MKDEAINGVKRYFNRNWNRDDVMNMDEIIEHEDVTSMLAAYSFGSSVGFIFNYLFKVEFVLRFLVGITIGIGNLLYQAIKTKDRREIYTGCLKYCVVIRGGFTLNQGGSSLRRKITQYEEQIFLCVYILLIEAK
ncbi:hypothetical protein MTR67_032190 [Solanum verrucosum]|uniref:Uncharacterized protein n=1 Tax=Solanum verrucosum TaxID=315347 RepID=A0AAF0U3X7_SOLVR|nr:hypothetical protein MTR67_032190 [Solanum verrucosum]